MNYIQLPSGEFTSLASEVLNQLAAGGFASDRFRHWLFACLTVAFVHGAALGAVLKHRYPFDLDSSDVIGSAHGTVTGTAQITNGVLGIPGKGGSDRGFNLPTNVLAGVDSISIEMWFADERSNSALNIGLWSFEGSQGRMAFEAGGWVRCETASVDHMITAPRPFGPGTNHFIWSHDQVSGLSRIYWNGVLVTETNVTWAVQEIGDLTGAALGHRPGYESVFVGAIHEFRIYQGALTQLGAAASFAAGPERVVSTVGNLERIELRTDALVGVGRTFPMKLRADFTGVAKVDVTIFPEAHFESNNPEVVELTPSGQLRALAPGRAVITAKYGGMSTQRLIRVLPQSPPRLLHRYSFTGPTNSTTATDMISGAHGKILREGRLNGLGQFVNPPRSGLGYVDLPDRLVSILAELTIEAWVAWTPEDTVWPRIFDFGDSVNGRGTSYLFLTAASRMNPPALHAAFSTNDFLAETLRLAAPTTLPTNVLTHVAVSYSPLLNQAKLYLDGELMNTGVATVPLSQINDVNNWLGKSQFNDSPFAGSFDEFRIYSGTLTDGEIAASYAAGTASGPTPEAMLRGFILDQELILAWPHNSTSSQVDFSTGLDSNASWVPLPLDSAGELSEASFLVLPKPETATFFRLRQRTD